MNFAKMNSSSSSPEDRRYDEESYCPEKTNNTFEKESWANNGEKPDMPQTCSMMMKQVQLVKEAVKLLRSNFGISIKLLKVAPQADKEFRKKIAHGAKQKTTWVLEWFPYVERVFLRIVGGKT